MTINEKDKLRGEIMLARKNLDPEKVEALSASICRRVKTLRDWALAREVLGYMAVKGEVNILPLLRDLWRRGARVLLPRCRPEEPGEMDVACPSGIEEITPGSYGIPEPHPDACPPLEKIAPDLVLVPGVAFDRSGKRLGMGGGYYDRLVESGALKGSLLVAPAYSFQIVDRVPADPWDCSVNVIVTEEEVLWV